MKLLAFVGDSLKRLREFPPSARQDAGYQLHRIQEGKQPSDSKPMRSIGPDVAEVRIWDAEGTFRIIYTARVGDMVYVLHAFQKKSEQTPPADLALARKRFKDVMKD